MPVWYGTVREVIGELTEGSVLWTVWAVRDFGPEEGLCDIFNPVSSHNKVSVGCVRASAFKVRMRIWLIYGLEMAY